MDESNEMFITMHYKVLRLLVRTSMTDGSKTYSVFNQQNVAHTLNCSRTVVNRIYNDLQNDGWITMITRGQWEVSKKAIEMIHDTAKWW